MVNIISFPNLGITLTVSRSLFSVFGIPVYSYGLIIGIGVILGFIYASNEIKRQGITQDDFLNMFITALPVAILCARLYYVIFSWDFYKNNPLEILDIRGGGLAIYGGIIGAFAVVLIYCKVKKLNIGKVLDILAVSLLIGQSVGRWGNFVNGEAFGSSSTLPWAMSIESEGRLIAHMVHPTFLYESVFNAIGIVVLLLYKRKKVFQGELFCGYMVWYGIGRVLIEGLRADSLYWGPFRVSQMLSGLLVIIGLILIFKNRKQKICK